MDDTRGCCKYCGKDLEPGQACADCLAAGMISSHAGPERSAVEPAILGKACLLDSNTGLTIKILGPQCGIGRHHSNELSLDDAYISRFHARLTFENGRFYAEDLGSTNGTLLNHIELISSRLLRDGDRIRVGKSEFIYSEKT